MSPPGGTRFDYAFPLAVDPASRQVVRTHYAQHVAQMIRQFLLTTPGERVCLPDYGGGLRRILFAPKSVALRASTELLVRQGLAKYLGQHIEVISVTMNDGGDGMEGTLQLSLEYKLLETQTSDILTLEMR